MATNRFPTSAVTFNNRKIIRMNRKTVAVTSFLAEAMQLNCYPKQQQAAVFNLSILYHDMLFIVTA
jgi:hypothetical protein